MECQEVIRNGPSNIFSGRGYNLHFANCPLINQNICEPTTLGMRRFAARIFQLIKITNHPELGHSGLQRSRPEPNGVRTLVPIAAV